MSEKRMVVAPVETFRCDRSDALRLVLPGRCATTPEKQAFKKHRFHTAVNLSLWSVHGASQSGCLSRGASVGAMVRSARALVLTPGETVRAPPPRLLTAGQ